MNVTQCVLLAATLASGRRNGWQAIRMELVAGCQKVAEQERKMRSRSSSVSFPKCETCEKIGGYHAQVVQSAAKVKTSCDSKKRSKSVDHVDNKNRSEFKKLFGNLCKCGICKGKNRAEDVSGECQICTPHPCLKPRASVSNENDCGLKCSIFTS